MSKDPKKDKWEVLLKMDDNNKSGIPKKAYTISDADLEEMDLELSVIKADNKHGHNSWGWNGDDKIILLDESLDTRKELEWWLKVAEILKNGMNKNDM